MREEGSSRRRFSIGARWTLRYTTVTALLLFLLGSLLYAWLSIVIRDGIDRQLRQYTRTINETIARNPYDFAAVTASIETAIASSSADRQLVIELYDEAGRLVLQRDILAPFDKPLSREVVRDTREAIFYEEMREAPFPYFVRVERNGSGFTRAAIYGGPALRELAEIRSVLLAVSAIGMILTGVMGWWLARQTLRPIAEIIATAKRVSALGSEDLIPTHGTGDELDLLSQTLNAMLERLRHNTDRMRRFAAQAAHELLTPLGIARTRIEVTLAEESGHDGYRDGLGSALSDIEMLTESVNAVLEIARSGAGLDPARLETIDLSELLSDLAEFYEAFAEHRGVQFRAPPPLKVKVIGDPVWLHRLFSNIVDNAIKYSDEGGVVSFEVAEDEGEVDVVIRDTSAGIVEEERGRIFDRFYRGGEQRKPGHGLGLALSMEIARAHGGTIEYESPEEGGSIFRVQLPTDPVRHDYART